MKIQSIDNVTAFAKNYHVILCDLWGVIHNGKRLYQESLTFLENMKKDGKFIILISNAPRPNNIVEEGLNNKLNLSKDLYDLILTSGDVGCEILNKREYGNTYYHLGPKKDQDLLKGISLEQSKNLDECEFVLCTGIDDDEQEKAQDYSNILEEFLKRDLMMVCVNPDKIVYRGSKQIPCAGSVAELFLSKGGKVKYFGKPYNEIYEHLFHLLKKKAVLRNKAEILAIGDGMATDILGAINFGIDFIFIQSGIHQNEINSEDDLNFLVKKYIKKTLSKINTASSL